jgi:hypothetical protein
VVSGIEVEAARPIETLGLRLNRTCKPRHPDFRPISAHVRWKAVEGGNQGAWFLPAEAGKEVKKNAPHGGTPKVSRNVGNDEP